MNKWNEIRETREGGVIMLKKGNGKIDKSVGVFSLPPCPMVDGQKPRQCHKYCYALKVWAQYENCRTAWSENLDAINAPGFENRMFLEIIAGKYKRIRINASGDFFKPAHYWKWIGIAKRLPEVEFLAFTKSTFPTECGHPSNLKIIFSQDGVDVPSMSGTDARCMGFDAVALVSSTKSTCPNQQDKTILCGKGCVKCWNKNTKQVIFKKH